MTDVMPNALLLQWSAHRERADDPIVRHSTWDAARAALVSYLNEEYKDDTCPHCRSQAEDALNGLTSLAPGAEWEDSVDGEDLELKRETVTASVTRC